MNQITLHARKDYDWRTAAVTWSLKDTKIVFGKVRQSMISCNLDLDRIVKSIQISGPKKHSESQHRILREYKFFDKDGEGFKS